MNQKKSAQVYSEQSKNNKKQEFIVWKTDVKKAVEIISKRKSVILN